MAEFEYNAIDREGRRVTGRVEADDVDGAIMALSEQGISARRKDVLLLSGGPAEEDAAEAAIVDGNETPAPRLSGRETAQLVGTVSDLTSSGLPLSAGLRAAAEEIPQRRVAAAMRRVAEELDRGVSLDRAIEGASGNVPAHLRGLILAGLRTGRVAHVLEELVAMDRDQSDLRRRIVTALAYPTILFALLVVAFFLANIFIIKPFSRIFDEFALELPAATIMTISMMQWFDRSSLWTALIAVGIALPALILFMYVPKPADVQRSCYRLPILGPLWKWQSLVDFSRLMHLLLERRVPMTEALRMAADGLRWSDLSEASRACAADVEKGMPLPEAMARRSEFPPSMRPVIQSGMRTQEPAEAFAAAADMYRRRAGVDVGLWEAILPPIILVFVAVGVGFLILAMFLPLIKLIASLT